MTSFGAALFGRMVRGALLQSCAFYCKADIALLQITDCSIAKPMPLYGNSRIHTSSVRLATMREDRSLNCALVNLFGSLLLEDNN